jgi:tetratricopeptide (TPR) repeat protein
LDEVEPGVTKLAPVGLTSKDAQKPIEDAMPHDERQREQHYHNKKAAQQLFVARFEECLAETRRAHSLDPAYLVVAVDMGCRLYEARRYTEAIAPIEKVLEFNPGFAVGHRCLGQVYEANGMYREAIPELQRAVDLAGEVPMYVAALGHAYAVSGQRDEARKALRKLDELAKRRYVSNFPRALICAGLGEKDRALEWLERAFQEHSSGMVKLKVDPRLDPLRQDARFKNLLGRVGLTP